MSTTTSGASCGADTLGRPCVDVVTFWSMDWLTAGIAAVVAVFLLAVLVVTIVNLGRWLVTRRRP